MPSNSRTSKPSDENAKIAVEFSSREVKPPTLLLQDLLRAHSTFLLHHASSISALFVRTRRSKFIGILSRYWDSYLSVWNVLLHGNPAVNIYGGIKLAASGELGVGVGEEERGSGEREVLEGFVPRIDGLVDIVVSRFGYARPTKESEKDAKLTTGRPKASPTEPWLGTGAEPAAEDGAIFLGTGALSHKSLRDVTHWLEDIYSWGSNAYGVKVNPTSARRLRQKSRRSEGSAKPDAAMPVSQDATTSLPIHTISVKEDSHSPRIGSPSATPKAGSPSDDPARKGSISNTEQDRGRTTKSLRSSTSRALSDTSSTKSAKSAVGKSGKFVNFLKFGYGTHWSLGGQSPEPPESVQEPHEAGIPPKVTDLVPKESPVITRELLTPANAKESRPFDDSKGHYLVGLLGDLEEDDDDNANLKNESDSGSDNGSASRTLLRTLTVELERASDARAEADISIDFGNNEIHANASTHASSQHTNESTTSYEIQDRNKTKKLRIVVYVNQPFIYAFLFELRTSTLAYSALYKSLHHQLGPLQRPLLVSTQETLSRPEMSTTDSSNDLAAPIYDLIWDPKALTVTSTIPNIPLPIPRSEDDRGWSRMEALNTHMQVLNTYNDTRLNRRELERTAKTSRGWWVVWSRILDTEEQSDDYGDETPSGLTPTLKTETSTDSNQTATSRTSTMLQGSLYSGPAHPFLERSKRNKWVPKDKEIFLIRKASDYMGRSQGVMAASSGYLGEGLGWGSSAPAKLAQGIGVDTKRYIEGLLNMGR